MNRRNWQVTHRTEPNQARTASNRPIRDHQPHASPNTQHSKHSTLDTSRRRPFSPPPLPCKHDTTASMSSSSTPEQEPAKLSEVGLYGLAVSERRHTHGFFLLGPLRAWTTSTSVENFQFLMHVFLRSSVSPHTSGRRHGPHRLLYRRSQRCCQAELFNCGVVDSFRLDASIPMVLTQLASPLS